MLISRQLCYKETPTQVFSCEYCNIFKNLYFKGDLWTTASELYLFKVEQIIEKTETYLETIIGNVFRTRWNMEDEAFCKNSCLYLTDDYFCKRLHIACSTGLWICLEKLNRAAISANFFLNYILSSHYYLSVRY